MPNLYLDTIKKFDLCIGCGLCVALSSKVASLKINKNGFYEPEWSEYTQKEDNILKEICPGIKIRGKGSMGVWGTTKNVYNGWSNDSEIRHKAASGGIVTSLAICLLENHLVDAVLQIGKRNDDAILNEMKVSTSREEIIENSSSRYAPAPTLINILKLLQNTNYKFLFIGKPCDIGALHNFLAIHPEYKKRFIYTFSILCAGIPSYNASIELCKKSGFEDLPKSIKYRGDGWPGKFIATWTNGQRYELCYNESWGQHLGRFLPYRCKICPDGIGLLADIAVGDSWATNNGYPDFTEGDGISFIISRTQNGELILDYATKKKYITLEKGNLKHLRTQQPYQYQRRIKCGWRLLPLLMLSKFKIHYNKLSIIKSALHINVLSGIRNSFGSYKRLKK